MDRRTLLKIGGLAAAGFAVAPLTTKTAPLQNSNGYWFKERNPNNYHEIVKLWPLPAFAVTPIKSDPSSAISAYRYTLNGRHVDYLPEDIVSLSSVNS